MICKLSLLDRLLYFHLWA